MNKILKWFLIGVGILIVLPVVGFIIWSVTSPRDAQGRNVHIAKKYDNAHGDLVIAYIKSAELSVLMFEDDKQTLPKILSDLTPYGPSIDKIEQASIRYTKIGEKSFSLCGPYAKDSTNDVNTSTKTWSVAGGQICLTEIVGP